MMSIPTVTTWYAQTVIAIQSLVTWYQQTWWIGLKEVLTLLGFLVAAFTYRRNTLVRAQDVKANQIQRTFEVMKSYPSETRNRVLKATKQLDFGFKIMARLQLSGASDEELTEFKTQLVGMVDLITLLHVLDPLGYLLNHNDYLEQDEAMNTFASEVRRILLDERLADEIERIIRQSTMTGITQLQALLINHRVNKQGVNDNGR